MGSILENLHQVLTGWGVNGRRVQWYVNGGVVGVVALMILSALLSAAGLQEVVWFFLAVYVIVALCVGLSPFFWAGVATISYGEGQIGGAPGLDVEDGINNIKKRAPQWLDWYGFLVLFCGVLPFVYFGTVNTKGYVLPNLIGLVILPTALYFVWKRFKGGEKFFNAIGYIILAALIGIVALTAYNTVERSVTDPATQEVLNYLDQTTGDKKALKKEVVKVIIAKLKAKEALTADEKRLWDILQKEAQAQSLRPEGLKAFVENAKPTDKDWWKAHWVTVGGVALAIIIGYLLFGRTRGTATGATPAAASAHGAAPTEKKSWRGWIIILALAAWCWYSISEEFGWPGTFVANLGYEHQVQLIIPDLKDQEVCDPALRPGKWRVVFPDEAYLEDPLHKGRYLHRAGFFVNYPDGQRDRLSFQSHVLVNGVETGRSERVTITEKRCYKITIRTTTEAREKAVVYGNPLCGNIDACVASVTPKPGLAVLRFYN